MSLKVRAARELKDDNEADLAALTAAMHAHRAEREEAEAQLAHEREVAAGIRADWERKLADRRKEVRLSGAKPHSVKDFQIQPIPHTLRAGWNSAALQCHHCSEIVSGMPPVRPSETGRETAAGSRHRAAAGGG